MPTQYSDPGGKIIIEGDIYDAVAEIGFIEKDEKNCSDKS